MSKAEFRWLRKALKETNPDERDIAVASSVADAATADERVSAAALLDEKAAKTRVAAKTDSRAVTKTDTRTAGRTTSFDGFWWFNMNPRPELGSLSKSEKAAIAVFEFTNVIPVDKRDCRILEKMLAECDGIFAKAVRAFSSLLIASLGTSGTSGFLTGSSGSSAMKDFINFHVVG